MAEMRSSFLDDQGELILGEYTLSNAELEYLKGVDREEAGRALADMGAAAVLIDGRTFSDRDRVIGSCESLPLELNNGDSIKSPGQYITWGIEAAQVIQQASHRKARRTIKVMEYVGITAHSAYRL